jgi:Xaa-Pro dipeptidase
VRAVALAGLRRVVDAMARADVDVLLLGREANARYVSHAARLYLAGERAFAPGCVVVRETGDVHLLSTGDAGIPAEVARANLYPLSWNPANLFGRIAALPGVAGARRVGVDGLTPLFEQLVAAYFAGAEVVDGEALLRAVRRVKEPDEIDRIRAAIVVASEVLDAARAAVRANASDAGVVAAAMAEMARQGVTTAAFEPVLTRDGAVTAIDVGVLRDGWEGGLARTEPSQPPPPAHREAMARCTAGALPSAVAGAATTVHGVGTGYEVLDPDAPLVANMVLSLATGPVRDLVLVTDDGPDVLTATPY